ncbi:flagellar hook-associated protein FlgK [Arenibacterium sp. CAU 1754]
MTLSTALSSALSGLHAAGRASGVVSENISNALTPGYARRTLNLQSLGDVAPGVRVTGLTRHVDPAVLSNRRTTDARFGNAQVLAGFHTQFAGLVGTASEPDSIIMRLTNFESSLISAASRPDSVQRLDAVAMGANDLAGALNTASNDVQTLRTRADNSIATQVDRLNHTLEQVQDLNTRITAIGTGGAGGAAASLLDQRQILVDEINEMVPVNVVNRDFGQIALYSDGGAILLDGTAAKIGFEQTRTIVPEMTIESGALSGLEINGIPVRTASGRSPLSGGTLSAQFQIRDELAITAQADLDSVARDLIERFQDPALDATRAAGDPGLFTDAGNVFDAADEIGLAGRLAVNALADPEQGGESWRLRDGLGTLTPGEPGNARLLQELGAVLGAQRTPGSGNFGAGQLTAAQISTSLLSRAARNASAADQTLSFATAGKTEMDQIELANGVDTDAELSALLLIEQAYAANARMITVVDEMMQSLLRI